MCVLLSPLGTAPQARRVYGERFCIHSINTTAPQPQDLSQQGASARSIPAVPAREMGSGYRVRVRAGQHIHASKISRKSQLPVSRFEGLLVD
jgi:hypothetical protein